MAVASHPFEREPLNLLRTTTTMAWSAHSSLVKRLFPPCVMLQCVGAHPVLQFSVNGAHVDHVLPASYLHPVYLIHGFLVRPTGHEHLMAVVKPYLERITVNLFGSGPTTVYLPCRVVKAFPADRAQPVLDRLMRAQAAAATPQATDSKIQTTAAAPQATDSKIQSGAAETSDDIGEQQASPFSKSERAKAATASGAAAGPDGPRSGSGHVKVEPGDSEPSSPGGSKPESATPSPGTDAEPTSTDTSTQEAAISSGWPAAAAGQKRPAERTQGYGMPSGPRVKILRLEGELKHPRINSGDGAGGTAVAPMPVKNVPGQGGMSPAFVRPGMPVGNLRSAITAKAASAGIQPSVSATVAAALSANSDVPAASPDAAATPKATAKSPVATESPQKTEASATATPPKTTTKARSGNLAGSRGRSCHQCKNARLDDDLMWCTRRFKLRSDASKRCQKKYCSSCLARFYSVDINLLPRDSWICMSCQDLCFCAACCRRRLRLLEQWKGMAEGEAGPQASQDNGKTPRRKRSSTGIAAQSRAGLQAVLMRQMCHPASSMAPSPVPTMLMGSSSAVAPAAGMAGTGNVQGGAKTTHTQPQLPAFPFPAGMPSGWPGLMPFMPRGGGAGVVGAGQLPATTASVPPGGAPWMPMMAGTAMPPPPALAPPGVSTVVNPSGLQHTAAMSLSVPPLTGVLPYVTAGGRRFSRAGAPPIQAAAGAALSNRAPPAAATSGGSTGGVGFGVSGVHGISGVSGVNGVSGIGGVNGISAGATATAEKKHNNS